VSEIEPIEQIQVSEEKKENLETSDIQYESHETKSVPTKQDKKQKRPPKGKRKSENERKSESECLAASEPDNLCEPIEVKTSKDPPSEEVTELETTMDKVDEILLMKETEGFSDDLDLEIPSLESEEKSDIQVEPSETKSVSTKQDKKQKRAPKVKRKSESERKSESDSMPTHEPVTSEQTDVKAPEAPLIEELPAVESTVNNVDEVSLMKEPEAFIDDLDLVIPTLEEIKESEDAIIQPKVEEIQIETHKNEETFTDTPKKVKPVKSRKSKKEVLKSMEDDKSDIVTPVVDDLLGVDPILDTEESSKPKERKEKSKQKTAKQGKKGKPSAFEAAILSAGETALEPTPAVEEKIDVEIPIVDDLLGVDQILDTEDSDKPKERKEKSSKQKTPKQGKNRKPSLFEEALVTAGETALEPTPAPSDGKDQTSLEQVLSAAGSVMLASVAGESEPDSKNAPEQETDQIPELTDTSLASDLLPSEPTPSSEKTSEASENVEVKPTPEATQIPKNVEVKPITEATQIPESVEVKPTPEATQIPESVPVPGPKNAPQSETIKQQIPNVPEPKPVLAAKERRPKQPRGSTKASNQKQKSQPSPSFASTFVPPPVVDNAFSFDNTDGASITKLNVKVNPENVVPSPVPEFASMPFVLGQGGIFGPAVGTPRAPGSAPAMPAGIGPILGPAMAPVFANEGIPIPSEPVVTGDAAAFNTPPPLPPLPAFLTQSVDDDDDDEDMLIPTLEDMNDCPQ